MEAFLGTVLPAAFDYAPRGWAQCNGQTMNVQQFAALFSLLGVMYGGDGRTTFGIPDLRGRAIVGSQGAGPGLTPIPQGSTGGANNVNVVGAGSAGFALTTQNIPPHTHTVTIAGSSFNATSTLNATTENTGGQLAATGATLCSTAGVGGAGQAAIYQAATPAASTMMALNPNSVTTALSGLANLTTGTTGTGAAVSVPISTSTATSVMQPYLGLNYLICIEGIFPARN